MDFETGLLRLADIIYDNTSVFNAVVNRRMNTHNDEMIVGLGCRASILKYLQQECSSSQNIYQDDMSDPPSHKSTY